MLEDPATVAEFQARLQALKLRRARMPYQWIAVVMKEYHGIDRRPNTWRELCRAAHVPSVRGDHPTQFKAAS